MGEWWQPFLVTLPVNLAVGAISALITARLALRRFRDEKWWERRCEKYTNILESLHVVKTYCDVAHHSNLTGKVPEDELDRWTDRYNVALLELKRDVEVGDFLISSEAVAVLEWLRDNLVDRDRVDHLPASAQLYANTIKRLRPIARRDLHRDGWAATLASTRFGRALSRYYAQVIDCSDPDWPSEKKSEPT